MQVEFLGTSGFHPTETRHTSCVFIAELGLVFDAGTGIFRLPFRLKTDELDIVISHSHLDHIIGLTYLLPHLAYGKLKAARVYTSAETIEAIRHHLFSQALFPVKVPFEFHELTGPIELAGARLTYREQEHPGTSLGFRLDWSDRSLAYVTDTVANVQELEFVRNVDLLIHECSFPDRLRDIAIQSGHSTTSNVCRLAKDAGVKRLYLTHLDPYLEGDDPIEIAKARKIFEHAEVAEDKMTVEF